MQINRDFIVYVRERATRAMQWDGNFKMMNILFQSDHYLDKLVDTVAKVLGPSVESPVLQIYETIVKSSNPY